MFDKTVLHLADVLENWLAEGYPCLDEKIMLTKKLSMLDYILRQKRVINTQINVAVFGF